MKILLDAAAVLVMSGVVLLWIWLWDIAKDEKSWFLTPSVAGVAFCISLIPFALGVYLLLRKERESQAKDRDKAASKDGWNPNPGFEALSAPKQDKPKWGAFRGQAEEGTAIKRNREASEAPAMNASKSPEGGGWKPSARQREEPSPYIVLGVHESDTLEIIKDVYARLKAIYQPDNHPDVNEYSKAQKAAQMVKINTAYEWIINNHVNMPVRPPQKDDVKILYREACELINSKEYVRGIQTISKLITLDPNDAGYFNLLGISYERLNNYQEAVKAFDSAIALGANNASIFNLRGFSYAQMGDAGRAIEDYGRAIKLDPAFSDAFNNRGITHKENGDLRRAIEDFNKAIQLDPKFAAAYTLRGLTYGELGGHQSKVEDFKTAARLGTTFAQEYLNEKGIEW